jgi:hypothetical protein
MSIPEQYRTFRITGAGDRFIYPSGIEGCTDELNASTHPLLNDGGYVSRMVLSSAISGESLAIHAIYDGSWSFALSPADPDSPYPSWCIRRQWGTEHTESEALEIDVPPDTKFMVVEPLETGPSSYAGLPPNQVIVRPPPYLKSELYRFAIIILYFSLLMLPPVAYAAFVGSLFQKNIALAAYAAIAFIISVLVVKKQYPQDDYTRCITRDQLSK